MTTGTYVLAKPGKSGVTETSACAATAAAVAVAVAIGFIAVVVAGVSAVGGFTSVVSCAAAVC